MKKTMLTVRTLSRFEAEYKTAHYTAEQIETIEHAAYVANMNQCNNPEWTEADIFADFLRVLSIHHIETEPAEADETETEPGTAETNEEEKTMYNYKNAMMNDILDHIVEEIDRADYIDNRDELEEKLNDELFVSDVTGNASGSYYCNAYKAREAVIADGFDYIREAVSDFGIEAAEIGERFINEDWEWLDVTIRCYLLGQMVNEVLDELEESGYFEESEIDETDIMQEVREAIA